MPQLVWNKITFSSDEEYYETLGYLCKEDNRPIDIFIEDNRPAGAWGVDRRITISERVDLAYIPVPLANLFARSRRPGGVSDYFKNLVENHDFTKEVVLGTSNTTHLYPSSIANVLATVPANYVSAFNRGYIWNIELLKLIRSSTTETNDDEDVVTEQTGEIEGTKRGFYTTKYERSKANRTAAIREHGTVCQICGFDYSAVYGDLGTGYIEVHHIKPLATLDEAVVIDPKEDLACVCANCHRMLHRYKKYMIGISELKQIVDDNK